MKSFFITFVLVAYYICYIEAKHVIKSRDINNIRGGSYSSWSEWTEWSKCSRTCGGGVRQRNRVCTRRFGNYNQALPLICLGDTAEYTLCNSQECPSGAADFRDFQCYLYNNKRIADQTVREWIPQYGGENPCELRCQAKDRSLTYSFGKVIDGTRCFPGGEEVCVNGRCLPVGCDHKVGFDTSVDKCGICAGNNSTCIHYKNIYLEQFHRKPGSKREGYQEIAVIPAGATHIEVHDYSKNYLAVKDDKSYGLNGNWAINWPGEYKLAGTNIRYTRSWDDNETLSAPGPTNRDIYLMILFRGKNPGVSYEYWLPKEKRATVHRSNTHRVTTIPSTLPLSIPNTPSHTWHHYSTTRIPSQLSLRTPLNHVTRNYQSEKNHKRKHHGIQSDSHKDRHSSTSSDLNYHRYWTDDPTSKTVSVSIVSVPEGRNNQTRVVTNGRNYYGVNGKSRKNHLNSNKNFCDHCAKSKDLVKHFCKGDFVLKVKVLTYEMLHGETRYELNVLQSYKNNMDLLSREYIWTPNKCRCPRMKVGQEYLVIGRSDPYYKKNESRLILDNHSFSKRMTARMERRVSKLRKSQQKKCKKFI